MTLTSIGSLDLEFLYLGYVKGGKFDEKDVEDSALKRLGVGRVLDAIASLKERKLITQENDGKFCITNSARQILWNDEIPNWVKILRLLEIKAFPQSEIIKYLALNNEELLQTLEILRKNELALMSPHRTEKGLEKMFEILPAGIEELKKIEKNGFNNTELILEGAIPEKDIFEIIDEIKEIIENNSIDEKSKNNIYDKLEQIKNKLKI